MSTKLLIPLIFTISYFSLSAQNPSSYLKTNAVRIDDSQPLSDSVYQLLAPFQIIMVGEMHGTNEPAQFVTALAKMLASKGDSVQVGMEISSDQMKPFITKHTDSSIYESDFFAAKSIDGRASYAWANVISLLMHNPKVQIFFLDMTMSDIGARDRDSVMYLKLKRQYLLHPNWKMLTLSGNYHNMTSPQAEIGRNTMGSYLNNDQMLNLSAKICSLNHYYLKGSCRANFGEGLEERELDRPENEYDMLNFDRYLLLMSATSTYPYTGFYYTKIVTPAKMIHEE